MTNPAFSASTLHEAQGRAGALPAAIQRLAKGMTVSGPAFTVRTAPGENLVVHAGLVQAPPGSVLVVATDWRDGHDHAYWGDVMTTAARARGIQGLVIDGQVRDVDEIAESGFPVFSRGAAMHGPGKGTAGSVGETIRIGEVDIHPGDLIVGDGDGVVCVPAAQVETVYAAAQRRVEFEAEAMRRLQLGETAFDIFGWKRP